jgi:nucleotide-binding universal stress UspA family protein
MKINDIPAGAVVVGVDGSQDSVHAVDWAADHAKNEGRDLVLIHGVGAHLEWVASGGVDPRAYLDAMDQSGQAVLDTALARVAPALPEGTVHTVLERLEPRTALLAASEHASVLVLGSRGMGPVKSLLVGSVGAAVTRHSHCPTVVVRPHHPGTVRRGVLAASDGTEQSAAVLEFAFRQASEKRLPLTVLHTEWDPTTIAHELTPDHPDFAGGAITLAETVAGLSEKYPDVHVVRSVWRGHPAATILRQADDMNLVVVGHGHQDPISRVVFGSVSHSVLEHAKTVVAVVPHG